MAAIVNCQLWQLSCWEPDCAGLSAACLPAQLNHIFVWSTNCWESCALETVFNIWGQNLAWDHLSSALDIYFIVLLKKIVNILQIPTSTWYLNCIRTQCYPFLHLAHKLLEVWALLQLQTCFQLSFWRPVFAGVCGSRWEWNWADTSEPGEPLVWQTVRKLSWDFWGDLCSSWQQTMVNAKKLQFVVFTACCTFYNKNYQM